MALTTLNELGQEIFETRYAYPGETKWGERAKVIAKVVASAESDEDKEKIEKVFYDAVGSGDFIPGGRIIFGAGRNRGQHNLLNCYVIIPEDSVDSIGKTVQDMYKISCAGGGVGFNVSKIRPKGDHIGSVKHSAPGAVSVLQMINEVGEHVRAGKNRRTALMGILNITHPDLLDFLHVKLDEGELTNFNISVAITDRFLEAIELDEDWYFTFNNKEYHSYDIIRSTYPIAAHESIQVIALDEEDALARAENFHKVTWEDTFEVVGRNDIKARKLWELIWENSVESGDPGIYNIDLANRYTNVSYFEKLDSTNPCGEISLPSYGNCCLGNVNLSNMVLDDGSDVDWKRLARTIRTGIRFLDNVLTINTFPTDECKIVAERSRRIGLGVTGLHYMLIKLGLKYGSEKCLEFLERLFATMRDESYKQSIYLARDKTPFAEFDRTKYLQEEFAKTLPARIRMLIKRYGIRNAVMLTIPPCGTISMLHGVSTGIEPIFSAMYNRRWRHANTWKEQLVVDPLFKEWYDNKKNLDNFVGAYDVPPEDHIKVQATIQKYMDNCLSKTINLPAETTPEEFSQAALDYTPYLKGLTVYRAGSKDNEPLEAIALTEENIKKYMKYEVEEKVQAAEACSLVGGDCGD
ncbi:MAG TPA: adenosylcobalamin-dependent ribonucleoside-diphosphate reductase [Gammaproteobacteria bacterium]|nr:adenosylcobalamin-dependent ribonucleoside-diphosphate reductase [Gammaproteobacteria bacterium]